MRDKLWFFSAFRHWGYERRVASRFFNQTPTGLTYTPDLERPAIDYQQKIATQPAPDVDGRAKNKQAAVFYENQTDIGRTTGTANRLHVPGGADLAQGQEPNYMTQARWSMPATSRLLFDAGSTFVNNDFILHAAPGATTRRCRRSRELRTGASLAELRRAPGGTTPAIRCNVTGSVSYVTGSHTFKAGALFLRSSATTDPGGRRATARAGAARRRAQLRRGVRDAAARSTKS